ncbi:sensor histidine kinase [Microbispora sp. NPDC049125]|uniref:sensor histidine kinase n=1 Tax=Microbispora sp. NPDC049125 TaxID=3154929 RepID=UPI003465DE8C
MRWSVRLRATVVATVTVALALGGVAAVLLVTLNSSLLSSAGEEASRRADEVVKTFTQDGDSSGEAGPLTGFAGPGPGVAADPDVQIKGRAELGWGQGYATAERTVKVGGTPVTVQARTSLLPARNALTTIRTILLVGVPVLLALVAGLTWLLAGRALAPVADIRAEFSDITASDLHRRVPVPATGDEVALLARTMNVTLDRLEGAVERHRRFVADAAHELRSPLAILRTRLELGSREAPALVRESLTDVGRIQALSADLLLLARLDAGEPLRTQEVDLGQVASEEALRTRREDVKIRMDVAADVVVSGSRPHLSRMIANLVDNAVRHAESTVTVRVTAPATVEVSDDGPGIPADCRESVFGRFTRLDEGRARDEGGSGLGLAIARDIAHAHGGTLIVAEPDGTAKGACLRADLRPSAPRATLREPAAPVSLGALSSPGPEMAR